MKLSRVASYTFFGSLFAVVITWGYLPTVWLLGWPQLALLGLSAVGLLAWIVFSLDAIRAWLGKRSTRFGIGLAITAVMSVVLLATVNWLANAYNVKKDFTLNQLHTLSDQTKKIAAGLQENVTVRVWSTSVDRMSTNMDMRRFLENYEKASHGKLKVEIKNPNEDRTAAASDNVKRDNLILVKSASGREARVENFNDTKGEEQITNAIVQALKGRKKTVCFLTGHGEISLDDSGAQGLSQIKAQLVSSAYDAKEVALASSEKMPADCEALVIAGPRGDAIERERHMIREYLEAGGKAIALLGPGTAEGWKKLVAEYGPKLRNDIIIDPRVQPPIAIATKNFAQDVDIVRSFNRLVILPETSSIDVSDKKAGVTVRAFVSSEGYTFAKAGDLRKLSSLRRASSDLAGPLPVAVLITKALAGASDKPPVPGHGPEHAAPAPGKQQGWLDKARQHLSPVSEAMAQESGEPGDEEMPPEMMGSAQGEVPAAPPAHDGPKNEKKELTLVVVANHNFVMNSFVTQVGNQDFFLNAVNSLLKDQDLIGIRPREIRQASLELSRENLRQVSATVLLVAGLFLLGGILAQHRKAAVDA